MTIPSRIARRLSIVGGFLSLLLIASHQPALAADIMLKPDANADSTAAIQSALDNAASVVVFPAGTYRTGTLTIPAGVTLRFDPKARLVPIPDKVADKKLLFVKGDDVRIEGLHHDFAWNGADIDTTPVHSLIYAEQVAGLFVTGADVGNTDPRGLVPMADRKRRGRLLNIDGTDPAKNYSHHGYYADHRLLYVIGGRDIVLENSVGFRLHAMIETVGTHNVTARGNRMVSGNYLTKFMEGGESLRHHDNWSRDVKYQVCWFGGSPDPSRKGGEVPLGSANQAFRDIKPGEAGYNRHTSGAFDVSVQDNYAEYGNTLAWGNKGRQVVIDGNIARFISDYAYGSEGGENI
ncbi:MAG: right-handed parallel beta-helix repeat-containing protein, partial [Verrucomicrobiota bacterium]